MKAADIPDRKMLEAIRHVEKPIGASIWDIAKRFPDFPEKVVRAKLHALIRRKVIHGCVCGCRGDFTLTPKGDELFSK